MSIGALSEPIGPLAKADGAVTPETFNANFERVRRGVNGMQREIDALVGVSPDRGDANVTLTVGTDHEVQRFATTLTANRTVTLPTTGGYNSARFHIVRTGLGNFTLAVGTLKTLASATAAWAEVMHDGTAWRLIGQGTL